LTDEIVAEILATAGTGRLALHGQMAGINTILNMMPHRWRERLLQEFMNNLFSPGT
jgi:hypothetical protein